MIAILGDVHANFDYARACVAGAKAAGAKAVIQVGDFGIATFARTVQAPFALPVYVIDGNHEDHEWLWMYHDKPERREQWMLQTQTQSLFIMPRGSCEVIEGITCGFLGGAYHAHGPQQTFPPVDKRLPTNPLYANYVLERDVQRMLQWPLAMDLMVTHSCPADMGVGMAGVVEFEALVYQHVWAMGGRAGPNNDTGEGQLADLYQQFRTKPKEWVFGHFHELRQRRVGPTMFTCVGRHDGQGVGPRVWYDLRDRLIHVDPRASWLS